MNKSNNMGSVQPKVSVIIPVYNAEKYLTRCIESVLAQSLTDFELILVDDGSTDNSGDICDSFAKQDKHISVLHKENGGASSARNAGIDIAHGNWICFIDSDDYVRHNYLKMLLLDLKQCKNNQSLVIQGMKQILPSRTKTITPKNNRVFNLLHDANSFFNEINLFKFCGPCCKLFNRSIIIKNSIRFSTDIICAEDFDFLCLYLVHCQYIYVSTTCNYIYEHHPGSISSEVYSFNDEYNGLKQLSSSLRLLEDVYPCYPLMNQRCDMESYYTYRVLLSCYKKGTSQENRIKELKSIDKSFTTQFFKRYHPESLTIAIAKYLFKLKLYSLLDTFMSCRFIK